MCEASVLDALKATLYADIAIAPMLLSAVPEGLTVLEAEDGLPALPPFCINMHLRRVGTLAGGGGIRFIRAAGVRLPLR